MSAFSSAHSFHIPVMGIAFSIDAPYRVAPYGIHSVISLVDDILIENMREHYSRLFELPFQPIGQGEEDFRARRITAYLDLMDRLVKKKFEDLKKSALEAGEEIRKFMELLPDRITLRRELQDILSQPAELGEKIQAWLHEHLPMGRIDVNIMTKLDRINFRGREALPVEYNDAHAALRGFAQSGVTEPLYSRRA